MMSKRPGPLLRVLLIFGLLALCVTAAGLGFYSYLQAQWAADKAREIESIAVDRAAQVALWRAERLADAAMIAESDRIRAFLHGFTRGKPSPAVLTAATEALGRVRRAYRYESVSLLNPAGRVILSSGSPAATPLTLADLARRCASGGSHSGDSFIYEQNGRHFLAIAGCVPSAGGAALFLEATADLHLRPMLNLPVRGATIKVVLASTNAAEPFVASRSAAAPEHIHSGDVRRAIAAGREGFVWTHNQRGDPVIANIRRVHGSSWYVIATVAEADALGSRERVAALVFGILLFWVAIAGAAVRYIWQRERLKHYQQLYQAERERAALAEHYRSLNRFANDAILLTDQDLRIIEANERALELYGYSLDEMVGMDVRDLRVEELRRPVVDVFQRAGGAGGIRYETIHLRKDGTVILIEASLRLIHTQGGDFFQTIIRDITEKKKQQQTILRLYRLYDVAARVNQAIARAGTILDVFDTVCRVSVADGGMSLASIFSIPDDDQSRELKMVTSAGTAATNHVFSLDDGSLTAAAIRSERTQVCSDVSSGLDEPFRTLTSTIGVRSLASTPLLRSSRVVGALTLGSSEVGFFGRDEVQLLEMLGRDLSFALDLFEHEAKREMATAALRESEQLFHSLADSVSALLWIGSADGNITYLNTQWAKFTGQPVEKHLGKGWEEAIHPEDLSGLARVYDDAIAKRCVFEAETRLRRHDGVWRWMLSRAAPQFDASGKYAGHIATCIDITERRERDAALRIAEEHHRLALDVAGAGTSELDLRTGVMNTSPGFRRICGFGADSAPLLADYRDRVHPDDLPRLSHVVAEAIRTNSDYEDEHRILWPDGSVHWLLSRGRPLCDGSGAPVRLVSVALDVTERVKITEQLSKSESAFRRVASNAHDGICEIDDSGVIRFASPRLAALAGSAVGELTGALFLSLIHPDERAQVSDLLGRGGDSTSRQCEVRLIRKDGDDLWVSMWLTPIVSESGAAGALATVADISARKRLEAQLLQASKMEAIGQLAGGVAHDFNNLLTISLGYAQLAAGAVDDESPVRDHIRQIIAANDRGAALTRQLLVFSRDQMTQPQHVDLNAIVADLEKMLRRLIGENITLRSRFSPGLPLVFADRGQMEQVVMNLVVNARDAMPKGGYIDVETYSVAGGNGTGGAESKVHLRVHDTGIGMDEATRRRIFEPFFTTKPRGRGTGLGLATVYGIVSQAAGTIEVTSEPGRGTEFDICFPGVTEGASAPVNLRDEPPVLRPGKETILLIEDDDALRTLVEGMLRQGGYVVLSASSGAAACEMASSHDGPIDIILTDVILPGMTGPEAANAIRRSRPGVAVVLMSGYTGDLDIDDHLRDGGELLQKPFTIQQLSAVLRRAIEGRPVLPKRIIVADDDVAVRDLLRLILEEAGYEVTEAENGLALVRKLKEEQFDVAITDILMPEQDGLEALMALRKMAVDTRVIVLSGGSAVYLKTAKIMGASATLTKPVSPARLLATIESVLSGSVVKPEIAVG